jgi:hypothetical protein
MVWMLQYINGERTFSRITPSLELLFIHLELVIRVLKDHMLAISACHQKIAETGGSAYPEHSICPSCWI